MPLHLLEPVTLLWLQQLEQLEPLAGQQPWRVALGTAAYVPALPSDLP